MKILFICSNLIGDTILSTGVIKHFIDENQDAKLTFVIGPTAAPLLKNFKNVEKIIIFKKKKFNLHWIDILKKTFGTSWDIIVDFRSSAISYILKNKKKLRGLVLTHAHDLMIVLVLIVLICIYQPI